MKPPLLYHYTCRHGHARITDTLYPARALLSPAQFKQLPYPAAVISGLVWLTDLRSVAGINRHKVGLTNVLDPDCDRTTFRYLVDPNQLVDVDGRYRVLPWSRLRLRWLQEPGLGSVVRELEAPQGVEPEHWWASASPIAVRLDQHRKVSA